MLPQVLAGLAAFSVFSASCVLWLQRFQPLFVTLALAGVAYQGWLVWRRPARWRSRSALWIFGTSVAVTGLVLATWVALWYRYQ